MYIYGIFCRLDRCENPFLLLQQMTTLLADNGLILVTFPLPFEPIARNILPWLNTTILSWEESATLVVRELLEPAGNIIHCHIFKIISYMQKYDIIGGFVFIPLFYIYMRIQ